VDRMPTSTTGINSKRGFTLLELLIVLAIMTVLSGVVLASIWPALSEARLRASARTVIAQMNYARSYAITYHSQVAVLFDTGRHGITVAVSAQDQNGDQVWQPLTTQGGRFRALPEEIKLADITIANTSGGDNSISTGSAGTITLPDGTTGQAVIFTALGQGENARITLQEEQRDQAAGDADAKLHQRVVLVEALTGRCGLAP